MITIANANAALKDYYLDAVNYQLNTGVSPFYNAIAKTTENVCGKNASVAVSAGHMSGVAATAEDGDLPEARANKYYNITVPLKNIYGTIEISDKVLRASANSSGAFVNMLNAEMDGLVTSARANFARMLFGDGNGYLCKATSQMGSREIGVDRTRRFFIGLKIKIASSTPVYARVVDINDFSNSIKIDVDLATGSVRANDKIYLDGAQGNELLGLAAVFNNTNLYGFDVNSDSYFKTITRSVNTNDLDEDAVINIIDFLNDTCSSGVNMIICSTKVRKLIASRLNPNRSIVNTTDLVGGFTSLVINGVPVYAETFCPDDTIYFLNTNDFILNQLCDWEWMEDENGNILRQVPGKAAYSATLVKYAELVCTRPNAQGRIVLC